MVVCMACFDWCRNTHGGSIGLGHVLLVGREFQVIEQTIAAMITIFIIG